MLLTLATASLLVVTDDRGFPEQVPGMIEACLTDAVASGGVTETEDSHKYICAGDPAVRLWAFLEGAKIESYEQDTPQGRWLGREFPLGACFKRIRMPGGATATDGLSCTIWIPRPAGPTASAKR